MSSSNYTASTYSFSTYASDSSSSHAIKGAQQDPQHTPKRQAVRQWAKQLAADLGRPPTYRYDMEHGKDASAAMACGTLNYGPFNNSRQPLI